MRIAVGHLYPDYLNIYADRGNIAVLDRRAALRGHELDVAADRHRRPVDPGATTSSTSAAARIVSRHSSRRIWPRRAKRSTPRTRRGVALLAVCGGYQLLGRGYRGRDGSFMPGVGLFPHETVAGADAHDRRRPARVRARPR